jgi:hypothetical protein
MRQGYIPLHTPRVFHIKNDSQYHRNQYTGLFLKTKSNLEDDFYLTHVILSGDFKKADSTAKQTKKLLYNTDKIENLQEILQYLTFLHNNIRTLFKVGGRTPYEKRSKASLAQRKHIKFSKSISKANLIKLLRI